MSADLREITATVVIPIDVATVWRALTRDRAEWWPDLRFASAEGAPVVEEWTENGERMSATGVVTRVEAGSLLEFRWTQPSWNDHLTVRFTVSGDDVASRVVVTERGFERLADSETVRSEHAEGWRFHLDNLAAFVTGSAEPVSE